MPFHDTTCRAASDGVRDIAGRTGRVHAPCAPASGLPEEPRAGEAPSDRDGIRGGLSLRFGAGSPPRPRERHAGRGRKPLRETRRPSGYKAAGIPVLTGTIKGR